MNTPTAHYTVHTDYRTGGPLEAKITVDYPTLEDAAEFAARFPKATRVRALPVSSIEGDYATVEIRANLKSTKAVGEANETGVRRIRKALAVIADAGIAVKYDAPFVNSYPTREAADVAIGL